MALVSTSCVARFCLPLPRSVALTTSSHPTLSWLSASTTMPGTALPTDGPELAPRSASSRGCRPRKVHLQSPTSARSPLLCAWLANTGPGLDAGRQREYAAVAISEFKKFCIDLVPSIGCKALQLHHSTWVKTAEAEHLLSAASSLDIERDA